MASGELIFVTGLYGAGKSTLVHAALDATDNLEYLKTTTTRPPRPEELEYGSIEYDFVSQQAYEKRRATSKRWDHTPVHEHSYGADIDSVNQKLAKGIGIICCTAPDTDTIDQMSQLYVAPSTLVWIDTPLEVANSRLRASGDADRIRRIDDSLQTEVNAAQVKQLASVVFEPVQDISLDTANFTQVVQQILQHGDRTDIL